MNGRSGSASSSALRSGPVFARANAQVVSASSFFCWRAGSMRTTSHARPIFSRPRMTRLRGVELPPAHPVGGGGREGVVVVVPRLAEGQHRQPREVARLVVGVEAPAPEEVAQRVDREGDVVQDEQPHGAAPQQAGQRGGERPADQPAQAERGAEAADRPSRGRCDRRSSRPDRRSGPARSACGRRAGCAGRASPCARGPGRAARRASPRRDRRAGCADRRAGRRRRGACDGRPPRR